ncbi:MAG: UDP-N-acetylglucosamine--N-acetylmuramyl-(pentapeptide) pyrophosphoryl-undecaprenol N-acetylglucosamine transferase [Candidatus Lustribacter sp.]
MRGVPTNPATLRVAFAGGGTGGHIYPALAIDDAIRAEYDPEHYEPRFFGNRHGLEAQLVTTMPLTFVPSAALQRKLSLRTLVTLWSNLVGIVVALAALRSFRPLMVVATGGYVCFPVVVAARILRALGGLRCGIALLEINVQPGLTNRLLAPLVDEVWTTYDASARYFRGKAKRTGTPVRASLQRKIHPSRARLELGLAPERTTIVVMGGSQGARSINEAVAALVTRRTLGEDRQVLHVSGERDYAYMQAEERDVGQNHVLLVAYLPDPANAYAAADVAIARAGASTLAELAATGTPSILVPYPHGTDNHQTSNAAVFAERGAAVVLTDAELDGDRLWWTLDAMLQPARLAEMRAAAASLATSDVGRTIVSRIEFLIPARVVESGEANESASE